MKTKYLPGLCLLGLVTAATAGDELQFNRDIRPILSENCFHCHGPDEHGRKAGLRLDTAEGAFADNEGVRAIVPGDPEASEAVYRIHSTDPDEVMPPANSHYKLSASQKADLERWIREGAPYEGHWAFNRPTSDAPGPMREIIDASIRRRLGTDGLAPSPPADRETLIRRLSLDLRGLPPTLAEIKAFLDDRSPTAWAAAVDRMLASPHCAERLALDWLDVARYADTNGYSIDDHREMWVWRDWLIHAFMQNKPYDTFLVEQLAGDLLPGATPVQKMATGFLRNSMNTHEGGTIPEEYRVSYIADKIDTVTTTFMGLTMKCAQCHDHKYDPISQKDYYRFFAFFNSATERGHGATNGNTAPIMKVSSPLGNTAEIQATLDERLARIQSLRNDLGSVDPEGFERWQAGILAKHPAPVGDPAPPAAAAKTGFRFPPAGEASQWIWSEKSGATPRILLRKSIKVRAGLTGAFVYYTCDNNADLYVNGKKRGRVDPWMKPQLVDITAALKPGTNQIAADARNEEGIAGFIAWVQLDYQNGDTQVVLSDPSWLWHAPPAGSKPPTFTGAEGWQAPVVLGAHGVRPWGTLPGPDDGSTPAPASAGAALAASLRTPPADRSDADNKRIAEAFAKKASAFAKRIDKALSVEEGIVQRQRKEQGRTNVMIMDAPGKDTAHMLMRGQYDLPGEEVQAGVPALFSQLPKDVPANRLALARWLVAEDNPLTARVAVNRYWQMIFGAGLVRTTEDFGSQGEWPSHPDLLDALAVRFQEQGWDVKHLLREIVLSRTYQQRSDIPAVLLESDPHNRLLARGARTRLPAELVRDNALAISGLLHPLTGGPSVYPEQPDGLWRQISHFGHGKFTAQAYFPDTDRQAARRSMYTFWKRTGPPPAMAMFDAPTRETCTVRRMNTNTPLQALVLLNDPQFLKAARALARRMVREGGDHANARLRYAFRLATARNPSPPEHQLLRAAFDRERARFQAHPDAARAFLQSDTAPASIVDLAAYTMVASTILNLNETITKQ